MPDFPVAYIWVAWLVLFLAFFGCKSIQKTVDSEKAIQQKNILVPSFYGFFVRIIRVVCRECLSVRAAGGRGMPGVKRLGYCAGSKNSNSEIGLAHE
jgi:hypothetical protein